MENGESEDVYAEADTPRLEPVVPEGTAYIREVEQLFAENDRKSDEDVDVMFEFQQVAGFLQFAKLAVLKNFADGRLTFENRALGVVSAGGSLNAMACVYNSRNGMQSIAVPSSHPLTS